MENGPSAELGRNEKPNIPHQSLGGRADNRDQGYSASLRNSTRSPGDEGRGGERSVGSGANAPGSVRTTLPLTSDTAFPALRGGIEGIENGPTGDRPLLMLPTMVFLNKSSWARVDLSCLSIISEPDCQRPIKFFRSLEKDVSLAQGGTKFFGLRSVTCSQSVYPAAKHKSFNFRRADLYEVDSAFFYLPIKRQFRNEKRRRWAGNLLARRPKLQGG